MAREETLVTFYALAGLTAFWTLELFFQPVITYRKLQREQKRIQLSVYKAQRALLTSLTVQVHPRAFTTEMLNGLGDSPAAHYGDSDPHVGRLYLFPGFRHKA